MSNKNDRWSALSMKERADLMNMYITNGISDLKEMKKHYNSFAPGGHIETDEYGYPADITPAVITQDAEFNKFLMTLPDNQRLTPEEDYHTYQYWKINEKPKDFSEALNLGMYHYDSSDNTYHANSVAFDNKGVGHFMKPKNHPTVKYELDWYNKGIGTSEGGEQHPLQGAERNEWEDFRNHYQLDSTGVDYKYVPRKHYNSFGGEEDTDSKTKLEAIMRSTNGITGQVFSKKAPFISIPTIIAGAKAYSKMQQDNPEMPSTSTDYTGAAIKDGAYTTDGGLGFATTDELTSKLGEKPVDFVDSYVYGNTPFEKHGVIRKTSTPEKHIYRTKLASMNREVPVYQTHRDTLNTRLVKDLNTKLSKGQVDLVEENFTHKDSPFQIGDTGIYYDGNNGFVARVVLKDGTVAEKALDIFDFTPSEWNYKVGKKAKEGLEFINKNGHPYLMTSPWYYRKDTRTQEQRLQSMGITLNEDGDVIRNEGDASGKVWDLYEALDFISSHPYETRLENGKIL